MVKNKMVSLLSISLRDALDRVEGSPCFTMRLFELLIKADSGNFERLRLGFPLEARCLDVYRRGSVPYLAGAGGIDYEGIIQKATIDLSRELVQRKGTGPQGPTQWADLPGPSGPTGLTGSPGLTGGPALRGVEAPPDGGPTPGGRLDQNSSELLNSNGSLVDLLERQKKHGSLVLLVGEVVVLVNTPGVLSDSLDIYSEAVINGIPARSGTVAVPNKLDSWRMLKKISEVPGRKVFQENSDTLERVEFKDTAAYKYRFGIVESPQAGRVYEMDEMGEAVEYIAVPPSECTSKPRPMEGSKGYQARYAPNGKRQEGPLDQMDMVFKDGGMSTGALETLKHVSRRDNPIQKQEENSDSV